MANVSRTFKRYNFELVLIGRKSNPVLGNIFKHLQGSGLDRLLMKDRLTLVISASLYFRRLFTFEPSTQWDTKWRYLKKINFIFIRYVEHLLLNIGDRDNWKLVHLSQNSSMSEKCAFTDCKLYPMFDVDYTLHFHFTWHFLEPPFKLVNFRV